MSPARQLSRRLFVVHQRLRRDAHSAYSSRAVGKLFWRMPGRRGAPPPQPRNAHLLQAPPQGRPALPHRVSLTVDFLSSLLGLADALVPFGHQQSLHRSLQHSQRLPFHLLPSLYPSILAVLPFPPAIQSSCVSSATPARAVEFGDTLSFSVPTFNRKSYRRASNAA